MCMACSATRNNSVIGNIPHACVHINVADIGAWEHVQRQRHAFFGKMQVRT